MADADLWVARLNAEDAAAIWPRAEPLLEPAIHLSNGLYEPGDVRDYVTQPGAGTESGWSLWIIGERLELLGTWTTHVVSYPRARVLMVGFAGGAGFPRYHELAIGETEKFAREIGCTRLHGGGRRGWQKFGFEQIGVWNERILP